MLLRTLKASAFFSAVLRQPSGSCGEMTARRPPCARTVPITLSAKAGVLAPARAATMKIEAFITLLHGRSAITCRYGNYTGQLLENFVPRCDLMGTTVADLIEQRRGRSFQPTRTGAP